VRVKDYQILFSRLLPRLIDRAHFLGYEVVMGELYRPKEMAEIYAARGSGIKNSNHTRCIAVDLNLFKDGKYLKKTDAYRVLGEWWVEQHELCAWGGEFDDGGHFSLRYRGIV